MEFSTAYMQDLINQIPWSLTQWILVLSFSLATLIQVFYYLGAFRGIPRWSKRVSNGKIKLQTKPIPVTVILTASNQRDYLAENLPLILEQDYPEFQVVVVDDASSDLTVDLLSELQLKYPNLYHTFVPEGVQNISARKIALTVGIKAAKYEHLLFTDANCKPVGKQWISSMMRHFTDQTSVVLAYSRYGEVKGLKKKFMAYDNLFQAIRYLGFAAAGKPYMGIGRNLAYKKELFFQQRGFASHLNLHSGEDDLFVSDVATKSNTRIDVSPESVMLVETTMPYYVWKEDRINRLNTSMHYKLSARMRIGMEVFTRLLHYGLLVTLLTIGLVQANVPILVLIGVFFTIRLALQVAAVNASAKTLGEKRFYFTVTLFDLVLPFYSFIQRLEGNFSRRKSHMNQILN